MKPIPVLIWTIVACLWISIQALTPAQAYEGDHYVWTYYLARHCGYTHRQAFQIASATYAIDWDPNTGPMPEGITEWGSIADGIPTVHQRKWTEFHAFTLNQLTPAAAQTAKNLAADRLWNLAKEQRNPGVFIHFIQDVQAHNGWDDVRGHGFAGHLPDFLSHDYPDQRRAKAMTQQTIAALQRFRTEVLGLTEPVAIDPTIWTDLNNLVHANPLPINIKEPFTQENVHEKLLDIIKEKGIEDQGLGPIAVLTAVPSLEKSQAVVNSAIEKNYHSGRFKTFPHSYFLKRDLEQGQGFIRQALIGHEKSYVAPELAKKWRQYAFDRDGRAVEDGSFAVENLQLKIEEPTVKVAPPTSEGGVFKVTVTFTYNLKGVVPALGDLPVAEWMELGSSNRRVRLRWVSQKDFDGRMTLTADVHKEDLVQNRLVATLGVHVAGLEPQWRRFQLSDSSVKRFRKKTPNPDPAFGQINPELGDGYGPYGYGKYTSQFELVLPDEIFVGIPFELDCKFKMNWIKGDSARDWPEVFARVDEYGSVTNFKKVKSFGKFPTGASVSISLNAPTTFTLEPGYEKFDGSLTFHGSAYLGPSDHATVWTVSSVFVEYAAEAASNATGYKLLRLPDPVFADDAPLPKSKTIATTPGVVSAEPAKSHEPSLPPVKAGTETTSIPEAPKRTEADLTNGEKLYDSALALAVRGNPKEAEPIYRQAIKLQPNNAKYHYALAGALGLQGKWKEAEAAHIEAARLEPTNGEYRYRIGLTLAFQNKLSEAELYFREAVRLSPNHSLAYGGLGAVYASRGQWPEAEASYREAVRLDATIAEFHFRLGNAIAFQGKWEIAEPSYRQAVRLDPANPYSRDALGNACFHLQNLPEAETQYREAIKLLPANGQFHADLAGVLSLLGRDAEALVSAKEAMRLGLKDHWVYKLLGL